MKTVRCILEFDCLEGRSLPSTIATVSPDLDFRPSGSAIADSDLGSDALAVEHPVVSSSAVPAPTTEHANPVNVFPVPAILRAFDAHSDDPAEAAHELEELRLWLESPAAFHALGDHDWQEDVQEFQTYVRNQMAAALPALGIDDALPPLNPGSQNMHFAFGSYSDTRAAIVQLADENHVQRFPERHAKADYNTALVEVPTAPAEASRKQAASEILIEPNSKASAEQEVVPEAPHHDGAAVSLPRIQGFMRVFLDSLEKLGEKLLVVCNTSLTQWLASALMSAAAIELARRQVRVPNVATGDLSFTDAGSFGLLHDGTEKRT